MDAETTARMICSPGMTAAQTIVKIAGLNTDTEENVLLIAQELKRQAEQIKGGDLSDIEAGLWSASVELGILHSHLQAKAMGALDNRALMVTKPEIVKMLLEMSLKVQVEHRKTLTALAQLKNPKQTTFVKQQLNQLNQLIQQKNDKALDGGREGTTTRINPSMETLGELDRSRHSRREAEIVTEQL